ncbi:MAG: cation:proton antiporter subunit C [archaeon]|nr:cation:proton antiporter subunit C [archaeon]
MIVYLAAIALIAFGSYTIIAKENQIKKVIGLGLFADGIHLLLVSIGYRTEGIAAIFLENMGLVYFSSTAVDPLPQALVLTSIVIELSITALALVLIIRFYKMYGTLKTSGARI